MHESAHVSITRTARWLLPIGALVAAPARAHADCPVDTGSAPAIGFLADATRLATDLAAEPRARVEAAVSALAASRVEPDTAAAAGAVAGEVRLNTRRVKACVAGSVSATDATAASAAAGVSFPFLLSGVSMGLSMDHDVELGLASRPEFLRRRLSRVQTHVSLAFLDFEMADAASASTLRVMIVPFRVETALDWQEDGAERRERRSTRLSTSMMRFVAHQGTSSGQFDVLALDGGWVEPESMASREVMTAGGALRISPLALQGVGRRWSFQLDGGFLGLAGASDCDQVECTRGAYRLALGRRFGDALVEARAGRDAFLAADDSMALEDRFTVTAAGVHGRHRLATSGFVAYTRAWTGGGGGATGGVDVTWSVDLGHGLWSMVRGERARSYYGTTEGERTPLIEASSRLMVGLGWSRGRGAPAGLLAR